MKQLFVFATGIALFVSSCKKVEDLKIAKTAWNPNLAFPLGYGEFGVYDILAAEDSTDLIVIDPNTGALALSYSNQFVTPPANDLIQMGSLQTSISLTTGDLSAPVTVNFSGNVNGFQNRVITLNTPNGESLNTVFFDQGLLDLHLETTLRHNLNVVLTFPDLVDQNNVPITRNASVTYSGTVPQVVDVQIDLDEITADFTGNGNTNELRVNVQTSLMGTGQPITGSETLSMDVSSSNFRFHELTGNVGQQTIIQEIDSVLLKIYKNASQGTFELVNPKVNFTIDNSFGLPMDIHLNELKTIETNTGTELLLLNFPTTISVAAPTVMGQVATSEFELNSSNTSNLSTIISPTPKYFYYDFDAQTNPSGPPPTANFVDENSECAINVEVDMPLEGYAYGFYVTDTTDFEFSSVSGTDVNMIDFVMLRLIVDNGFPVQVGTQITALDVNLNPVFTLFNAPENVVEPAPVDATGRVSSNQKKITDVTLTDAQIALLDQVKHFVIYGEASTTGSDNMTVVKLYDDYKLGLKLAMQIQASTQF